MNILFLEGDMSRRGGTERMTALLANAFCEKDYVWIISRKLVDDIVFFQLDNRVQHTVLSDAKEKCSIISQIIKIRRFIKKNKIDCVINVDIGMSIFGIPACLGSKTKVITWEHGNYFNNWNSRIFPYIRKFAVKCSNAMVVLTEKDKENYRKNVQTRKTIYVIPNPVECHEFTYNLNSKVIMSAGLLLPIKRFDRAIQAAAEILPKYPEWKWIICGEGPERTYLEELIAQNNLQGQMILLGTVNNMEKKYQNAAMFVMTSEMEGLPMVLLEAKSWGLPLISFDIMTGPSDIIRDGINGYLVKPYDTQALVSCIEKLIRLQETRMIFSDNSQLDLERFDFKKIINEWRRVMEV